MKYDFTTIIDRQNKDALAVDAFGMSAQSGKNYFFANAKLRDGFDLIPMWVADMNFATVPAVSKAIIARAEHPLYGYFLPSTAYFDAIIRWHNTRYGTSCLKKEHIGYENGVLGGVVSAMHIFAAPGDSILIHSPTYIGFTHSLENNGWNLVNSALIQDENGVWRMDYADMEEKLLLHHIHAAVLCSPHNPTGRVWERWELEKALELYKAYDVYVISDEIWADIVMPDNRHIPTQSISEDAAMRTVAMYAPSKTFNLAGLVGSYHVVYSEYLRARMEQYGQKSHYNNMNMLSMHALIAAYSFEGAEWLDELIGVLNDNLLYAVSYIHKRFRGVSVSMPEGTYMLFLDCSVWCAEHGKTIEELQALGISVGVIWQDGRPFHGLCHCRMNLALPKARMQEAFDRLDKYVFNA